MSAPEAAADELERAVRNLVFVGALINGTTADRFLITLVLNRSMHAQRLLILQYMCIRLWPPKAVMSAYYDGLPIMSYRLYRRPAGAGTQRRQYISYVLFFQRRWTDTLSSSGSPVIWVKIPTLLARMDDFLIRRPRVTYNAPVSTTILDQLWITTSGFFSLPPCLAALTAFCPDRILFSVDYPFSENDRATRFLHQLPLSPADLKKIAHLNADGLLKFKA